MANIAKWSPFEDLLSTWPRDIFSRDILGRLRPTGELAVEWSPRCDVTEDDKEVVIHAELPGVDAKDIEVTVNDSMLTVRGEKRTEKKDEKEGRTYSERFFGSFERSIAIPKSAQRDKTDARLKDGVLEVHLPKAVVAPPEAKKIEIKTG